MDRPNEGMYAQVTLWDVGGFVAMSIVGIKGANIVSIISIFLKKKKDGLLSAPFSIKISLSQLDIQYNVMNNSK